ncbi:MAG TPA: carbohydrate porin [Rhizomicrobium sp.]|nr:carbohydrate porin [Rhizomicrobium sp.]
MLGLLLASPARAQVLNYEDVFQRPTLTGDWDGMRSRWEDAGVQLGGDEILESLGNLNSGMRQGAVIEGRLELFANIDMAKAFGMPGLIFHANAYQIHGEGLTSHYLGNLITVSNIEAPPAIKLFDLWLQQSLFDDAVSLRVGQIAADDEFFVSQYATLFINATFGWPAIMGVNLPSGGPAYPVARPGLRARAAVSPRLTLTAAVFSGDPRTDEAGFDFHMNGDVFAIGEMAYSMRISDLPGTLKLGGWIHSGKFADQRFDTMHLSLANPASNGIPDERRGDYGSYFILDQLLWRREGTSDSGLGGFFRVGGNPSDRNRIEFHMDGGLSYAAPFGRSNDTVGIGLSYEQVSALQRDLTQDYARISGQHPPTPDFESVLEISYQAQLASWWIVQPDVQWIIHPGGRVLDLSNPQARLGAGAVVLGLRSAVAL